MKIAVFSSIWIALLTINNVGATTEKESDAKHRAETVAQHKAETIVAGRTDAGVHATGQVIHVDLPESLELTDLAYKLNRILDEDIRINNIDFITSIHERRDF